MNRRNGILLAFGLAAAAQLAVPAWSILGHERTLRDGQVFKFMTRPVDPADAFRGRYVWLSLEPDAVKVPDVGLWRHNQKAFAVLGTDTNGFATVQRLDLERPAGEPAVRVRTSWSDRTKGEVHIAWPGLDRYYMTEDQAPAAETAYRDHSRRTNQTCHVTVRVRGGKAVIESLFVENQPIQDWLREHRGK
jgi:uncharacterized membrane-anchored protein